MPPEDEDSAASASASDLNLNPDNIHNCNGQVQSLYIIRHGDRWDFENPKWLQETDRRGDPPLSTLGHQQARETGIFLDHLLAEQGIPPENITWLSSPFLRTLQTSDDMLNVFQKTNPRHIEILPEYSVFEWDGKGGAWHAALPPLSERRHYFPRLNVSHPSLFVPAIPEPRSAFLDRCNRVAAALVQRYPYQPQSAIVIVTHAAGCVGIARAAAQLTLQDITPAAPCSIFRLTRSASSEEETDSTAAAGGCWKLDAHDAQGSMNGYVKHLSDLGSSTFPWNHFGEDLRIHQGYTGPATSPLAPPSVRRQTADD